MIDWHTHILPGMDDGSKDPQESGALLRLLSRQGVGTVVATPHFYANRESVEQFLSRRRESFAQLPAVPDGPQVRCGAEVCYYPGISRLPQLRQLCIEGTELLLLEMPFSRWTEFTVRELVELASHGSLTLVLAHIDRYLAYQPRSTWDRLLESGLYMQVNADALLDFWQRPRLLSLLRRGQAQLLGSDCHNTTSRPPAIGGAMALVCRKLGEDFADRLCRQGQQLLEDR